MNYIITKNPQFFEKIGEYNFCNLEDMALPDQISVDSETTGLTARHNDMFCIQLGSGDNNYIIDFYTSEDHYTFKDVIPYLQDKEMIFHNAVFDLQFFYKHNFYPKKVRDTMIASKIIYNGDYENQRNDFGTCMKRELGIIYDKTEQKNVHLVKLSQDSTIQYSFNDVDRLAELHSSLEKKIDEGGFRETYDLHCQYARSLAYMESSGLPISSEDWKAKMVVDENNVKEWKEKIENYIFDNLPQFADKQIDMFDETKRIHISINSPLQMLKVFKAFGIPTKDKDGKDSINENIISKSKHEFVSMWLSYQEANHRVSTFGNTIYEKIENERIYTNFNIAVDTARISSRKGGINFLNFPADKETRDCFKANKGNVMVVCDWEGQENAANVSFTNDTAMRKSLEEGACLHCAFARVLFPEIADLSDEEIKTKHKEKRSAAKSPRFAFAYGGNAFTIHMNEGIPLEEAYKIETAFKELHKGIYEWGDKKLAESIKQGYISSVAGWKLKLPKFDLYKQYEEQVNSITREEWQTYKIGKLDYKKKIEMKEKKEKYEYQFPKSVEFYRSKVKYVQQFFKLKSEYQRLALNNPIQTCGSHMLKRAAVLLFNWIVDSNYQNVVKICNSPYDEFILECPEDLGEEVSNKLTECMTNGGNFYLEDITCNAEAHFGNSWYEAK